MLVSIIMPVYNAEDYLAESIGSVLSQKYQNWELICVNDGSQDSSLSMLEKYASFDSRIRVYSQINKGHPYARQVGIEKAKGEYISYLDADDVLSDDYILQTLNSALVSHADVTMPILYTDCFSKNHTQKNFNEIHGLYVDLVLNPEIAFMRTFPWSVHGLNLYKATHIKRYAFLDEIYVNRYNADELLTRYLLLYANKIVISNGIYYYRANLESISKKFSLAQLQQIAVDQANFELAKREGFSRRDLTRIAKFFFRKVILLKRDLISHIKDIPVQDFEIAYQSISVKFSWMTYIPLVSFKMLRYRIINKLPYQVYAKTILIFKFKRK